MNILSDLRETLVPLKIPIETGSFTDPAPELYLVVVPLSDSFDLHADNTPGVDVQEARLSIYRRGNYTETKDRVIRALLKAGYTITARQYIGYETETGYHHYNVDVARYYEMEE